MKKRLGNQEPTKKVVLPYKKSDYKKAVDFYEKSGRKAQKWQKILLKDILAYGKDNLWTHTKCGYSLPRRNGKNEIIVMRELYGLFMGEEINHTAHRVSTSHSAWERLCRVLDESGVDYRSLKAKGQERVEIPETGGRVEFRTRSSTGGLGEGFDLLVIDEAQEYTDDQETALKYVVSSSKNPQTIMCGTPPTPISSGMVFVNFRKKVLSGDSKNFYWSEWSVDENTNPHDVEAWYETNPSLGTIFTERIVEDEIGTDDLDFNIQRLGLWISYNQKSAISLTDWDRLKIDELPELAGGLYVGIKYGQDGNNVALSIAVKTDEGKIFIESLDCQSVRNGDRWILDFLKSADIEKVVVDGASGQNILASEMKDLKLKEPILPTVKEVIKANAMWERAIFEESILHNNQESLKQVVTNCEKRNIGSSGGFGYKSQFDDMDISLMDSCLLAHWVCKENKKKIKQKIYY